jgi:coproporphyrinogen III oxidase-like Fe-S oxidoreductase
VRRRNLPSLSRYIGALAHGEAPPREDEPIDAETAARERLLLGLRLDEPVVLADVAGAFDADALARLSDLGMLAVTANGHGDEIRLTWRGRFLGGGVTAELLA